MTTVIELARTTNGTQQSKHCSHFPRDKLKSECHLLRRKRHTHSSLYIMPKNWWLLTDNMYSKGTLNKNNGQVRQTLRTIMQSDFFTRKCLLCRNITFFWLNSKKVRVWSAIYNKLLVIAHKILWKLTLLYSEHHVSKQSSSFGVHDKIWIIFGMKNPHIYFYHLLFYC